MYTHMHTHRHNTHTILTQAQSRGWTCDWHTHTVEVLGKRSAHILCNSWIHGIVHQITVTEKEWKKLRVWLMHIANCDTEPLTESLKSVQKFQHLVAVHLRANFGTIIVLPWLKSKALRVESLPLTVCYNYGLLYLCVVRFASWGEVGSHRRSIIDILDSICRDGMHQVAKSAFSFLLSSDGLLQNCLNLSSHEIQ